MRRLDPYKAHQLTQLISTHYPNQLIMQISDGGCDLHHTLYEFTRNKGYEFDLLGVDWECDELAKEDHPGYRTEMLDLSRRQYNRHGRKYDNLFVTLDEELLYADLSTMLKKIYRIMKNAGIVTFLIDRDAPLRSEMDRYLEEGYFVAISHIDIFDDYDIVTAKKMHGWGAYDVGF